jgi:hypothetical protein
MGTTGRGTSGSGPSARTSASRRGWPPREALRPGHFVPAGGSCTEGDVRVRAVAEPRCGAYLSSWGVCGWCSACCSSPGLPAAASAHGIDEHQTRTQGRIAFVLLRAATAWPPSTALALQLERCSPGLIASRVENASAAFGLSAGVLAAGPVHPVYSLEPPAALDEKPRPAGIAARLVGRVGLSAEAAEARTLFDCHIWPECTREARLGRP